MARKKDELPVKKKMGATPFPWTSELEDEIITYIETHPTSLNRCCVNNPHWPQTNLIFERINKNRDFGDRYKVAKQHQIMPLNENALDALEDSKNNPEQIPWAKEYVKQCNWQAARLQPIRFGEKSEQTIVTNQDELSKENQELKDKIKQLNAKHEKEY
jgi:hypothetical protein